MSGTDGRNSKAGHDKEAKTQLRRSSDSATSSSDDITNLNELPPGVPVESLTMALWCSAIKPGDSDTCDATFTLLGASNKDCSSLVYGQHFLLMNTTSYSRS